MLVLPHSNNLVSNRSVLFATVFAKANVISGHLMLWWKRSNHLTVDIDYIWAQLKKRPQCDKVYHDFTKLGSTLQVPSIQTSRRWNGYSYPIHLILKILHYFFWKPIASMNDPWPIWATLHFDEDSKIWVNTCIISWNFRHRMHMVVIVIGKATPSDRQCFEWWKL